MACCTIQFCEAIAECCNINSSYDILDAKADTAQSIGTFSDHNQLTESSIPYQPNLGLISATTDNIEDLGWQ